MSEGTVTCYKYSRDFLEQWVREMMGGGFNVIYPMACFSLYLQKLDEAVGHGSHD